MANMDLLPLQKPRIYLVRILTFLVLVSFLVFILYKPIWAAFLANPGLNGLIGGTLFMGIILAIRQVARLFPEIDWVNDFRRRQEGFVVGKSPVLLSPLAHFIDTPDQRKKFDLTSMRVLLDTVASRLDEGRDILRYLAGLLVFLGLLGTFWGLIETVGSIGNIVQSLKTGSNASLLFDELKSSLAAPLAGMGVSFSSSLFGLAGSLVLGFLDLQVGQAQNRFFIELENWLARFTVEDTSPSLPEGIVQALERLTLTLNEGTNGRSAAQAMAGLAEGIEGLVHHMRGEQQLIRDWVESQAARERDMKRLLEQIAFERQVLY